MIIIEFHNAIIHIKFPSPPLWRLLGWGKKRKKRFSSFDTAKGEFLTVAIREGSSRRFAFIHPNSRWNMSPNTQIKSHNGIIISNHMAGSFHGRREKHNFTTFCYYSMPHFGAFCFVRIEFYWFDNISRWIYGVLRELIRRVRWVTWLSFCFKLEIEKFIDSQQKLQPRSSLVTSLPRPTTLLSFLSPTSVWLPYFNWKTFPSHSRIVTCHPRLEFISPFRMEGLLKRVNLFRDIDFTSRYTRRGRVGGCERKYIIKAKTF